MTAIEDREETRQQWWWKMACYANFPGPILSRCRKWCQGWQSGWIVIACVIVLKIVAFRYFHLGQYLSREYLKASQEKLQALYLGNRLPVLVVARRYQKEKRHGRP